MYKVDFDGEFLKKAKKLLQKYPSLDTDLRAAVDSLKSNPFQGESLGGGIYKVRLHIKSKRAGKSGGGRLIIHVVQLEETIVFISIYDKGDTETEDLTYLRSIVKAYWESH